MKKSVRITKATRDQLWAESDQRFENERAKGSTGVDMKARERDIRDMINVDGITYSGDLRSRSANKNDVCTRDKYGNILHIEIKHGAGALAYASVCDVPEFETREREMCLIGEDYVVYNLTATTTARTTMALEYRVSTREDFLDMLEEYCHGPRGAGFLTATKFSKDNTQINIQSQYVKQFWAGLQKDARAMCLWDFCTDILGRDPRWER